MATSSHLLDEAERLAQIVGTAAQDQNLTVGTAESLTSGQIAVHLGAAPEAGSWFSGGAVTYTVEAKQKALDVPDVPVISAECATAMAEGAARLLGADCTIAVTGVGGPDRQEGQPVGTVYVAIHTPSGTHCTRENFDGDPQEILDATTLRSLELLGKALNAL